MTESNQVLAQLLDAYREAVYNKDVDAFVAIYDDDLRVFDLWENWSRHGIDAWRNMAEKWFGSLGTERVIVQADEIHATVSGDLGFGHAFLKFTAVSADGQELRSLDNRISVGMKKIGGSWKIVHEHTSTPIDQSTQAILKRTS